MEVFYLSDFFNSTCTEWIKSSPSKMVQSFSGFHLLLLSLNFTKDLKDLVDFVLIWDVCMLLLTTSYNGLEKLFRFHELFPSLSYFRFQMCEIEFSWAKSFNLFLKQRISTQVTPTLKSFSLSDLNKAMANCKNYLFENGLDLSLEKSSIIIFTRHRLYYQPYITLDRKNIPSKRSVK